MTKTSYKFEKLKVWAVSLELIDHVYEVAEALPDLEKYNLSSQIIRAATSISLNIAEGSTSQSDAEQGRFLGYAIRSLVEVIACFRIIEKRNYIKNKDLIENIDKTTLSLFKQLQSFKRKLTKP